MKKPEELIEEIKQITLQYRAEVSSGRKPWPNSIITRVQELISSGLTIKKISDLTGIPYYSILNWRHRGQMNKKEKSFHVVAVKPSNQITEKTVTVTVPTSINKVATVTVTTPDGYQIKIEGFEATLEMLQRLRGQKCF